MYDARTNLSADVATEVRTHLDGRVYDTVIPRSVRLSEAPSHGLPIHVYAPTSKGAEAYAALADEIRRRDGRAPAMGGVNSAIAAKGGDGKGGDGKGARQPGAARPTAEPAMAATR
jgi:hypothetical protein